MSPSAPRRADRPTACLARPAGRAGADRRAGCSTALDVAFRARLSRLLAQGFGPTRDGLAGQGARILARGWRVLQGVNRIEGVMRGLAEDGALILELDDGGRYPCSGRRNLDIGLD